MGLKIALDTNRYVDFARGKEQAVHVVKSAGRIFLPLIVLAELRAGFLAGNRDSQNEKHLNEFINSARVAILLPDEQTSHFYARIFKELRDKGKPIPTNDVWIAALVVQHDLILSSNDQHFDYLPSIARI